MRAIVVGAGIGGLASAIGLRRAGVDAVVYERAADLRELQVGGGIHLWHNGMRALARIGLAEVVREAAGEEAVVERTDFLTASGRPLGSWPIAEIERAVGAPTLGIARSSLQEVLLGALGDDGLELGAVLAGFEEDEDGVTTCFADGREERGDFLVGADGMRSAVRAGLFGPSEPRFAGYASWQAFAELGTEHVPIGLFRVYWGRGARFLVYRVRGGRVYWEAIAAAEQGAGVGGEEGGAAVLERFAGWADPIETIVRATGPAAISHAEIFARDPLKRWGEGRVTLLGDAAHAMPNATGQGANQALEDAAVLARCVGEGGEPAAALRAYEARRAPRAAQVVRRSWMLSGLALWRRPWACFVRDRWLRMILGTVVLKGLRKDMAAEL